VNGIIEGTKHKPAMYALLEFHAELGGKIKENKARGEAPGETGASLNQWVRPGTVFRAALGVLRMAEKPRRAREIALGNRPAAPSSMHSATVVTRVHRLPCRDQATQLPCFG